MIWAPRALSANGLFTETDGIMAWLGWRVGVEGCGEGGVGHWPHSMRFLIELATRRVSTSNARSRALKQGEWLHAANKDVGRAGLQVK